MIDPDEEERQKEFEEYCRQNRPSTLYFAIFGIFVAVVAGLFWRGL